MAVKSKIKALINQQIDWKISNLKAIKNCDHVFKRNYLNYYVCPKCLYNSGDSPDVTNLISDYENGE